MTIHLIPSTLGNWYKPLTFKDKETLYATTGAFIATADTWEKLATDAKVFGFRLVLIENPD